MKPVLEFPELVAWATMIVCSAGLALPFFFGRVIYVICKKDNK